MSTAKTPPAKPDEPVECFVIMPISDADGYASGHFRRVYEDIIAPACRAAGFRPVRADEVKPSNLIHLDILQRLLNSPMAVCDLSTANPNVLFELGLRQAFDKPVALIQEIGTRKIFDIALLRYTEYRKERLYDEVIEDQKAIGACIRETYDEFGQGKGINSIVKLLSLSDPASFPKTTERSQELEMMRLVLAEVGQLRAEMGRQERQSSQDEKILSLHRRHDEVIKHLSPEFDYLKRVESEIISSIEQLNSKKPGSTSMGAELNRLSNLISIFQRLLGHQNLEPALASTYVGILRTAELAHSAAQK